MQIEADIITEGQKRILPNGAVINRYSHVVAGAEIGKDVMLGSFCYVSPTGIIGDYCRIQNHVNIYDGVTLGKNVFVGPHTVFTNHHNPQDRLTRPPGTKNIPDITLVGDDVTISANVTIIAPCNIGDRSMIGAGSTVLRNMKADERSCGVIK